MYKYFNNIWVGLSTIAIGLKITLEHLFAKNVTNQYPEKYSPIESGDLAPNSRNRLFLKYDDCNGCNGCVRACPVDCITLETCKVVPGDEAPALASGKRRGLWVLQYDIDFAKCCFCSLCTEVCPTEAVIMTQEFEYSTSERNDLLYKFGKMPADQVIEKREMATKYAKEQAAKKAAAARAKAEAAAKKAEAEADKTEVGKTETGSE